MLLLVVFPGPGDPAGELNLQQEVVGLSVRGVQRSQRRRRALQQPLSQADHRYRSGLGGCLAQPASPAGIHTLLMLEKDILRFIYYASVCGSVSQTVESTVRTV